MKFALFAATLISLLPPASGTWGFYGHRKINRLAVFILPPEMIGFYKTNIYYIEDAAVNPDRRRYAVEEEAARHYIDLDHYPLSSLPTRWHDALLKYGADTLRAHGILPWHLVVMYQRLRDAFVLKDPPLILKLSAELGHYVADAHVPLHTTKNYNGQLTGQHGIHSFWESRLPELFSSEYDFFVGRAAYVSSPQEKAWEIVLSANGLVETVLETERTLGERFGEKRFSFETRGVSTVKVYAMEYAHAYHAKLSGMVERQMREAIKTTGDLWYSAWIDAGQPDLHSLIGYTPSEEELENRRRELTNWKTSLFRAREHEHE